MLVVARDEFQSRARARLQQMDITAESGRKFNKVPQKIVADSEKLQNYKIHQRNEKELLYLAAAGGGTRSAGPRFQIGRRRLRDLGSGRPSGGAGTRFPSPFPTKIPVSSGGISYLVLTG